MVRDKSEEGGRDGDNVCMHYRRMSEGGESQAGTKTSESRYTTIITILTTSKSIHLSS
jgi:hypothetical protein